MNESQLKSIQSIINEGLQRNWSRLMDLNGWQTLLKSINCKDDRRITVWWLIFQVNSLKLNRRVNSMQCWWWMSGIVFFLLSWTQTFARRIALPKTITECFLKWSLDKSLSAFLDNFTFHFRIPVHFERRGQIQLLHN